MYSQEQLFLLDFFAALLMEILALEPKTQEKVNIISRYNTFKMFLEKIFIFQISILNPIMQWRTEIFSK